jgi:hypothetical protein
MNEFTIYKSERMRTHMKNAGTQKSGNVVFHYMLILSHKLFAMKKMSLLFAVMIFL